MTAEELVRGPVVGPAPVASTWTITREKSAGAAPGRDDEGARPERRILHPIDGHREGGDPQMKDLAFHEAAPPA